MQTSQRPIRSIPGTNPNRSAPGRGSCRSIRGRHANRSGGTLLAAAVAALVLSAASARAQIPPDIPLVQRLGTGARAIGMGGAYTAVADDYSALSYNPAGLAQIRRVEFAGAFEKRTVDNDVTYLGQLNTTPLDKGRIQSLGFAYPFPTYRGSLVIGFSYDRVAPLDQQYFRQGAADGVQSEQETILEDGSVGAYQGGVALEVSPNLSLGIAGIIYSGSSQRDRTFLYQGTNAGDYENTTSSTNMDITAVSGTFGAMLHTPAGVRLGLALHLPESFTLDGSTTETVRHIENGDTLLYDTSPYSFDFKDKIDLPFRIGAGLSWSPEGALQGLLLSGDLTYADWKQIDYAGPIRTADRGYAYRATTDLRAGAEYAFAAVPVRIRAGYVSQPLAYRLIGTDVFHGGYQGANLVSDRHYFTFGGGVLIEQSLTVDVAYATGSYERSGTAAAGQTIEKQRDKRLVVGVAFRL